MVMADDDSTISGVCCSFCRLMQQRGGAGVVRLFDPRRPGFPAQEITAGAGGGEGAVRAKAEAQGGARFGDFLAQLLCGLRARLCEDFARELDFVSSCLKAWVTWYVDADGDGLWMLPMMMHLSVSARRAAAGLGRTGAVGEGDQALRVYVEAQRQHFQTLARERERRPGFVWVACELLRTYFRLGQVGQVSFLLSAIDVQLSRGGFNPRDLPKSIAVTLYFFWGKHCIFDDKLAEADRRLAWAFEHCPAGAVSHRRKILLYLLPCKLRLGFLPARSLLEKYRLDMFVDIVQALRDGNARLFSEAMEEHMADFIRNGTYFLLMRLKSAVLRNLAKGVHREERRRQGDKAARQMDLKFFEHAFSWQDDCDGDETACVLSNLIVQGAVRGYLSHYNRKIVFAKENTFPPPSQWKA